MNELNAIVDAAKQAFIAAATPADLENAKALFLGKTGSITELMKGMAALPVEEKKSRGAAINVVKQAVEAALTERRQAMADAELELQLKAEAMDVSLPGRKRGQGGLHPVSLHTWSALRRFLALWVLTWRKAPRLKPIGSTSPRSTRRKTTQRALCMTRFMSKAALRLRPTCCAPTPARCRFATLCSTLKSTVR